jgi:hypothetical protein
MGTRYVKTASTHCRSSLNRHQRCALLSSTHSAKAFVWHFDKDVAKRSNSFFPSEDNRASRYSRPLYSSRLHSAHRLLKRRCQQSCPALIWNLLGPVHLVIAESCFKVATVFAATRPSSEPPMATAERYRRVAAEMLKGNKHIGSLGGFSEARAALVHHAISTAKAIFEAPVHTRTPKCWTHSPMWKNSWAFFQWVARA